MAAQQSYGQARDQVGEAATVVANSIEQQPLIALLIAGFVEGFVSPTGLAPYVKFSLAAGLATLLVLYLTSRGKDSAEVGSQPAPS